MGDSFSHWDLMVGKRISGFGDTLLERNRWRHTLVPIFGMCTLV